MFTDPVASQGEDSTPLTLDQNYWRRAAGLTLVTFAFLCLASPGRIDILDGQTRYDVARSLVDHHDSVIRDTDLWFSVFPGRDGRRYALYRFPQSLLGAGAVALADVFGPRSEARRQFLFCLTSAAMGALLVPLYAWWFRRRGVRWPLTWAVFGVIATPSFYYATSVFDDILGATAVVAALVTADKAKSSHSTRWALLSGLILGWAFNCKHPLGAYVFATLGALYDGSRPFREQKKHLALVLLGLGAGIAAYLGYDLWKFPLDSRAEHAAMLKAYIDPWFADPLISVPALLVSPGAGAFLYCPALLVSLGGAREISRRERWLAAGAALSSAVMFAFYASTTIFKGDPSWGPRYLTPTFAVFWLFTPWAAGRLLRLRFVLIGLGVLVQLLAVSVDPHRLYIERSLPNAWSAISPILLFHPAASHLLNRPREILEIASSEVKAEDYSPVAPTRAIPMVQHVGYGRETIDRYVIFSSFRPWWCSQRYLPPDQRPAPIGLTATLLLLLAAAGASFAYQRPRSSV